MRLFFLTIFFILPFFSVAQRANWLPIKVKHKWGFINTNGNIVSEPKYDAIGNEAINWNRFFAGASNFRLVEMDEKLGLIDGQGIEVLAPAYRQIRPLNDTLFAVNLDSLFTVVNRSGKVLMNRPYEDIRLLFSDGQMVDEFFMVKEAEKWGIHQREGVQVFPPQFGYIELIKKGKGYFKVKEDFKNQHWALYSGDAVQILPYKYSKLDIINDDFILAYNDDARWSAWDSQGNAVLEPVWYGYQKLNRHLVALKNLDKNWDLYSLAQKGFLPLEKKYEHFRTLNDNYIQARLKKLYGILDSLGNEVVEPIYQEILPAQAPFFRVKKNNWGLLTLKDGLIVPCEYQAISDFRNNTAFVRKNDLYGVINTEGKEIIPTKFERIQREDNYLKAFYEITMTLYEMNEAGEVVSEEFFPEVYTLSIGYEMEMDGASFSARDIRNQRNGNRPIRSIGTNVNGAWTNLDTVEMEGPWEWRRNAAFKKWEMINKETKRSIIKPYYEGVRKIPSVGLSMVFSDADYVLNRLSTLGLYPVDTACSMALFSHETGKFITDFDMIGLRRNDFEAGLENAVFIDRNGQFGLIDKNGKQVKNELEEPLRFSYIGKFINGKARACLGGRLEVAEQPEQEKLAADPLKTLVHEFLMTPTRFFNLSFYRKFYFGKKGTEQAYWGYIDNTGKFVIEPEYDVVVDFKDSLAVNKKYGYWGLINDQNEVLLDFIYRGISSFVNDTWKVSMENQKPIFFNKKGHELIGLQYDKFGGFSEDMCAVKVGDLWGYVDIAGEEVIAPKFLNAKRFSEGWAAVQDSLGWFFINTNGEEKLRVNKVAENIAEVGNFKSGLCWFKIGRYYGYFNKKGKIKLKDIYTKAFDFEQGVARVVYNRKTGLLNPKGKWVLKPETYEVIFPFDANGLAEVRTHFKKLGGLINTNGELLTPLKYRKIDPFIDGYARVFNGELYGFIDKNGKEIIPMEYAQTTEIHDGLVAVLRPNKLTWHYINTKNERAFKGDFEIAENFNQGYAFIQIHEFDDLSKMYIDTEGKRISPTEGHQMIHHSDGLFGMYDPLAPRQNFRQENYYFSDKHGINIFDRYFEDIKPFQGITAPVKQFNRWGVLNRTGIYVIEPKYANINQLPEELIHVKPSQLFGITNKKGETILAPEFDNIIAVRSLYRVERGEQIGYTDLDGEWIWAVQN